MQDMQIIINSDERIFTIREKLFQNRLELMNWKEVFQWNFLLTDIQINQIDLDDFSSISGASSLLTFHGIHEI